MELVFPLLLCLIVSPCKTMNQPEEKPNSVDPDQAEAEDMQDVGQPDVTVLSTEESQGVQEAAGEDRDINPRSNGPDIDLLADEEQEAPQGDVVLGKEKDHGLSIATKETAKTEDEYFVDRQVLEEEQITSDILKLDQEKLLLFTATQRPARNADEYDYYGIEKHEELDSRQRDILNAINEQGLREIERKRIESSFGTIKMLPSRNTTVFSGNGYTIYQGTPTSEMEFFNNVTRITGRAVLIHLLDQVDFFFFLDPAGQRFCLIFTVALSDLNPEYFQWFLDEKLLAVTSEVITFCLNGIHGSCPTTVLQDIFTLCSVIALLLMMSYILRMPIRDFLDPLLEEMETHYNITINIDSIINYTLGALGDKIGLILKIVQLIREEGYRFLRKLYAFMTTDSQPGPPTEMRNKKGRKKGKNGRAHQQSKKSPNSVDIEVITQETKEIQLGEKGKAGAGQPKFLSSVPEEGQQRAKALLQTEEQVLETVRMNSLSDPTIRDRQQRFEKVVENAGMRFREATPADGNCFFHAIVDQGKRFGMKLDHETLRREVCSYVEKTPLSEKEYLEKFVVGLSWNDYLEKMSTPKEFVDELVVRKTAAFLGVRLKIYTSSEDGVQLNVAPHTIGEGPEMILGHVHENHYQSLEPQPGITEQAACRGPPLERKLKRSDPEPKPSSQTDTQKMKKSLSEKPFQEEEGDIDTSPKRH